MIEREAWIAFSTFVPIGPLRFKLLVKYFESAKNAWNAKSNKLREVGFSEKLVSSFERHKRSFDIKAYKERLSKLNIDTLTLEDKHYPKRLKDIEDSPFVLYVKKGSKVENLDALSDVSVAVVGARKMTSYGLDVTQKLVQGLALSQVTIVSGLALGIDSVAHKTAIENNGKTIGVLGGGLDDIYPPSNQGLANTIIISRNLGALVSEYPLGYPALPQNFPYRNRIVSGLSLAVLVIEGTEKSGTLLTAANAATQGRDVFAVPGPITSQTSAAPHLLIKNGAKLVQRVEDILDELEIRTRNRQRDAKSELPKDLNEQKIVEILALEPVNFDNLVRIVALPTSQVLSLLTVLELKGMVKNVGGTYRKI